MKERGQDVREAIQQMVARMLATSPEGYGLSLIGGFRYRLLNRSCRVSLDIDYHYSGDAMRKQSELVILFSRRLLPDVKSRYGLDGDVRAASGPAADDPSVRIVNLAFYRTGPDAVRIEVPVDITSIPCLDRPVVRTVGGTVYLTASDADLIEAKLLAVLNRTFVEARDLVDIFLFADALVADWPERVREKLNRLRLAPESVAERIGRLRAHRAGHVRAIDGILDGQVDPAQGASLRAGGGGAAIFDTVMGLIATLDPRPGMGGP